MKLILINIFALIILAGCISPDNSEYQNNPSLDWEKSMILGARFESVSDEGLLSFGGFQLSNNYVRVTIGDRNEAIAAPLWYWSIANDGSLKLQDSSGIEMASLELIEYQKSKIIVRNGENIVQYTRTQN